MAGQRYRVSGPAAVVATRDGSEQYLYRGAVFERSAYKAASIDHLLELGLLTELPEADETPAAEDAQVNAAEAEQTEPAAEQATAEKPAADRQASKPSGK